MKSTATVNLDVPGKTVIRPEGDTAGAATAPRDCLVALSFKVTKSFKKRYQLAALNADMKLNELLSAMLDDWEKKGQSTQ